jgi:hypothetical protein
MQHSIWTVIHDSAIPTVIDAARRRLGVVVLAERHSRNHNTGEAQDDDEDSENSLQSLSLSDFLFGRVIDSCQSVSFFFGQLFKH